MNILIRDLGLQEYRQVWRAMQNFTENRNNIDDDQLWFVEHPSVFTQGQAGKAEHIFNPGNIPIVQSDRGGQVTYHGPGQIVVYVMIDLRRKKLGIRALVSALETSIITCLADHNINARAKKEAPGVYVEDKKIASVGLRVKRGCSYHGIALNVDMDLSPFHGINPCGFERLEMTQLRDHMDTADMIKIKKILLDHMLKQLDYTTMELTDHRTRV